MNTNNNMEAKLKAKQRRLASCQARYGKLAEEYQCLLQDNEDITGKLEAYEDLERAGSHIRHTKQR
jgi:hypothetical protein